MVAFAFACLGVLVGTLSGLASSPVATALLAAVFTFAGGSAAHLIEKNPADRRLLGGLIAAFSVTCLAGLFFGIAVKENRWLTMAERRVEQDEEATRGVSPDAYVYLKKASMSEVDRINVQYSADEISAEQAYRQLRAEFDRLARQLP